ncbi:MAG: serine/threonine-protein kinase [Pirellulaceae bacterium]|jgi:serine/threonine protein kinase/WD40 repeat protein
MNDSSKFQANDSLTKTSDFYDLIEALTDRYQRGESIDLRELVTEYPQYAERLVAVVPTLQWIGRVRHVGASEHVLAQALTAAKSLNDFKITREIGRGGMGIVYEAEQLSLSRTVALKILPLATTLPERKIQRFKLEARAAAALNHPNIVPVYSVGFDNGVHFYAMQYIQGQSLADLLRVDGTTLLGPGSNDHWNKVAEIGVQIADALAYSHAVGIVHRDIKPANLLIDHAGKAWLADFGLAQLENETALTLTGDLMGTLRYMSPEQASGQRGVLDYRTDIYSLGITLYELLTLAPAFEDPDPRRLLKQVLESQPRSPRKLNPSIPKDLETIVLKSIAMEPRDRYASAKDLHEDLQRFLQHRPPLAIRPTVPTRLIRWSTRHVRALVVLTAILLVLTMALSLATGLVWRAQAVADASRSETEKQARETNRLAVTLALDRGLGLCDQGQISQGLLWLARALELTHSVQSAEIVADTHSAKLPEDRSGLQSVIRMNLDDWSKQLCVLRNLRGITSGRNAAATAFDSDARLVASATDRTVQLWNLATNELVGQPIQCRNRVTSIAFSRDGKMLLMGDQDGLIERHIVTNAKTIEAAHQHSANVAGVAMEPPEQIVMSAGAHEPVYFRNRLTGERLPPAEEPGTRMRLDSFNCVISADSKACVCWTGANVNCWDLTPEIKLRKNLFETEAQTLAAAFNQNGSHLLVGRASNAVLVRLPEGEMIGPSMHFMDHVSAVAFDPQQRFLLVGSRDRKARLYDASSHQPVGQTFEHERPIQTVAFTADGTSFFTACDGGLIRQWQSPNELIATTLSVGQDLVHNLLSPDGSVSFVGIRPRENNQQIFVQVREVASGAVLQELNSGNTLDFMALSAQGNRLVTAGRDKLCVWNWDKELTLCAEKVLSKQTIHAVDIDSNGLTIAVGVSDRVHLLDADTLLPLLPPLEQRGDNHCLRFSNDGKYLFSTSGSVHRCWKTATGQLLCELATDPFEISGAVFSHEGRSIIIVDSRGRVFRHNLYSGKRSGELLRQTSHSSYIAFHPDGKTVVSVGGDGKAQVLDLETGRPIGPTRQHFGPVTSIAFATESRQVGTLIPSGPLVDPARNIQVWSLPHERDGTPEQILLQVQVSTGIELDDGEIATLLPPEVWRSRKNLLEGPSR